MVKITVTKGLRSVLFVKLLSMRFITPFKGDSCHPFVDNLLGRGHL